jgi:starch phosphorylase
MAYRFPESVVFLENYDMELGRLLTAGCDVWLSTPQRPLEASATSCMKAALNGVLHLSTLDGWWPEAVIHGVNGWQFGGGYEGPEQTLVDAASLYEVLITEVIPTYYENRDKWVEMMRASIATAMHRFSAERMVSEYYNLLYLPSTTLRMLKHEIMQKQAVQ